MNIAKMEALAKTIENLSPKVFYMGEWVHYLPLSEEGEYPECSTRCLPSPCVSMG